MKNILDLPQGMQRCILYLLKSDDDCHHTLTTLIKSDYFELPIYKVIFSVVAKYREKYKTLPSNDIILNECKPFIGRGDSLEEYEDELHRCDKLGEHAVDNKEYLLDEIEKFAKRCAAKEALEKSVALAKENRFDEITDLFREVINVSRVVNVGHSYYTDLESRIYIEESAKKKFPFFLERANEQLDGGHSPKELCLVAAPPGVGKSLMLVNQAVHLMRHGIKVLYISLEMSEDKIAQRFDSIISQVNVKKLKTEKNTVVQGIKDFQTKYANSSLFIKEFPTGQATVNHIRVLLTQLKNQYKFVPEVVLVDYLELLRPIRYIDGEYAAQQRIAEELRGLGVEMGMLIWSATQTNRDARKAPIIKDIHFADSYGKVRTADWIVSLNQTDDERKQGRMRTYVVKARDSKNNYIIPTLVDYSTLKMTDDIEEPINDSV